MKRTKHRTARKLILPLIALAMMTTMMFLDSQASASHWPNPAALQR
jgi:hypothetical protein